MRVRRLFSIIRIAGLVAAAVLATNVLVSVPSFAASGTLSSLTQSVVSDGTSPFDSSVGDGLDTGAANGIIRTRDSFDLSWSYVVATAGDITFVQTLVNARWDSSSAGSCSQGASALSQDRRTITCTLPNLQVGSGSYPLRAIADGGAPNGSTITGTVAAGSAQSTSLSLTVSATPRMNIGTMDLFPIVSNGPGSFSSITGYNFDVPVAIWADVVGAFDGFSGLRGVESLSSPLTFRAVPNSTDAVLVSCASGPAGGTRPSLPESSGGNGTTVFNAVRNSGSWTCAQASSGTAVSVTVTGADTSLNSYPTKSANNSAITQNKAYVSVGYVRLWVPKSSTTPNATTTFTTQISEFDPTSSSGVSNFTDGFAPNQAASAVCVTGTYANCSNVIVNRVPQAVRPDVRVEDSNLGLLPGSAVSWDGNGLVTADTKFYASLVSSVPVANDTMTNVTVCMKWNPAQSVIDAAKPILTLTSPTALNATIEYGTHTYASLSAYQAGDCGRPGTGQNWFNSISAAGGVNTISAVRITFNGALNSGASIFVDVPQISRAGLPAGERIGFFGSLSSVETNELASTYNPATGNGSSGTRVTSVEARTGVTIAWDSSTSSLPAVREVTVTPKLFAGQIARDTRVLVKLPSACFDYVPSSASISPSTVTPADVGADGTPCTSDDGAPATLEFAFGDLSATPSPITFRTNISPRISVPSNQTISATISSPSDPVASTLHASSSTVAVSSVAGFSLAKTADTGRVTEGEPFNYFIDWRNGSATQSGGVKIVDVLPFDGDDRGSSGFSRLNVNTVTVPAGVVVEYSSLDASTALALAHSHPDGENQTFQWTAVKPPTVTAIRIVIANLAPTTSGTAAVNVTAADVRAGGKLKNDLYGVAAFASEPIRAAVPLEIQTLGTASLSVTKTANLGEVTAAGQILQYTIHVTNTGQEALSSITVTDHDFTGTGTAPTATCPSRVLASGATMECVTSSYIVPQSDLDTLSSVSNRATAVATPPAGASVTATDSISTPVRARSDLTLTQIPSPNNLSHAGDVVTYTFTATNSGTRTLSHLTIAAGSFNGTGTLNNVTCASQTIAPNASVTCSATYSVTQADLDSLTSLIHVATAIADDSVGESIQSNPTKTTVPLIRQPELSLSKSASVASFGAAGETIPFVFTVTNTGNVTLTTIGVDELNFSGTGTLSQVICPEESLAPNASLTCSATYVTTQADYSAQEVTNTARAFASFGTTDIDSPQSTVTVPAVGIAPGISMAVASDVDAVSFAEDTITYSFVLTNTGNVTLTGIGPDIASGGFNGSAGLLASAITCPEVSLDPLASMTCTAHYVVSQQDIDLLASLDLASEVRANAGATPVSAQADTVIVHVDPVAHLDAATTASRSATTQAGDIILFTVTLTNDGALSLEQVTAVVAANGFNGSGSLGAITCPPSLALAPGQSATCQVSYTVTQRDIDELDELQLTVDASGEHSHGLYETRFFREGNDTAQIEVLPREDLSLVKTASQQEVTESGDNIRYEFRVTNLGTRTLFGVVIEELSFTGSEELGAVSCPSTLDVVAPGETAICEVTYVTSELDMQKKQLENTAVAAAGTSAGSEHRNIRSLQSTARVFVPTSDQFGSDIPRESELTLTGATHISQMLAAALALLLGGTAVWGAWMRRRT